LTSYVCEPRRESVGSTALTPATRTELRSVHDDVEPAARHVRDARGRHSPRLRWSGGYDLYDLVSSPLAQPPGESWLARKPEVRVRPVWAGSPNFGCIDFDLTGDEPLLRFTVIGTDGRSVWTPFTLRAGELQNGVRS
jgi:hypothetical protein